MERMPPQNFETEVTDLIKLVQEIRSILNEKLSSRKFPRPSVQPLVKHEVPKWTAPIKEMNGIGIHGKPESEEKGATERQEHDLVGVRLVLVHLEVDTLFTDLVRLEQFDDKDPRTILLKNPNPWHRRLILSSATKLKTSGQLVLVNREHSKVEADFEKKSLIRGREIINQGLEPRNIRMRNGAFFFENRTNGPRRIRKN